MAQAYRSWRDRYGEGEWEERFQSRFLEYMRGRDTHFYVGTHSVYPT